MFGGIILKKKIQLNFSDHQNPCLLMCLILMMIFVVIIVARVELFLTIPLTIELFLGVCIKLYKSSLSHFIFHSKTHFYSLWNMSCDIFNTICTKVIPYVFLIFLLVNQARRWWKRWTCFRCQNARNNITHMPKLISWIWIGTNSQGASVDYRSSKCHHDETLITIK